MYGVALLLAGAPAAAAQGIAIDSTPAAQAWATDCAYTVAVESGNTAFADAIVNGDVVVYPGDLPADTWGASWPGGPGEPDVIVVAPATDEAFVGAEAAHEWAHLANGHALPEAGCEPTDEEAQEQACNECEASCAAVMAIVIRYLETGQGMSCTGQAILSKVAEWTCFECAWGVGAFGPPNPDPCDTGDTSLSDVPCSN